MIHIPYGGENSKSYSQKKSPVYVGGGQTVIWVGGNAGGSRDLLLRHGSKGNRQKQTKKKKKRTVKLTFEGRGKVKNTKKNQKKKNVKKKKRINQLLEVDKK